ncbi:MAG TPA: IS1182 family transposase [Spirochaetota bacterium]|nr:IS1182 family transposase [Spirochaetota bacterium]
MKKKRKRPAPVFKEYNQDQMWLFPPSIDELIPQNHIVRTVNTAINGMDLSHILRSYKGGGTSSYHPQMLLKVLIYAYTQKIYSSRNIAKALRENINFMWISGNNRPDFRTINRFRSIILKENIEKIFSSVLELLFEKGFVKFENYFLDGTKIEANANKYTFVWGKSTKHYKERLQKQVSELLDKIDVINDKENKEYGDSDLEELGEGVEVTAEDLEKTIRRINEGLSENETDDEVEQDLKKMEKEMLPRLKKYEDYEKILGKRNSFSKTDHDATFMRMKDDPMKNGHLKAGYNVQIGTENQFILGYSIHQKPGDTTTFIPHMNKLEEMAGKLPENIIADAGYGSEENYAFIESHNLGNYVKYPNFHREQRRKFREEIFRVENLPYDPASDEFTCPAGKKLRYTDDKVRITDNGYIQKNRIYTSEDCRWCRKRKACHKSRHNRRIEINPTLIGFKKKVSANLKSEQGLLLRSKRPVEVESVFGHIKHNRGFKKFMLRGIDNVSTEWGLISIAHNLFKMNLQMA